LCVNWLVSLGFIFLAVTMHGLAWGFSSPFMSLGTMLHADAISQFIFGVLSQFLGSSESISCTPVGLLFMNPQCNFNCWVAFLSNQGLCLTRIVWVELFMKAEDWKSKTYKRFLHNKHTLNPFRY
jgi:hypothetical protein